jgi:hypothetical protein
MHTTHIWEKIQICLEAENTYLNPYTEVAVWVDLLGPDFEKRVYGFWDGDNRFEIRLLACSPGNWTWNAGSNTNDPGLSGKSGAFYAEEWDLAEKESNPTRRGFIKPTDNGHGFVSADGTPQFIIGDTWWATPTFRYPWYEDETERPVGPEMGFKDMVRYRKNQGYNSIAILAGFPTWAADGLPSTLLMDDGLPIRAAWEEQGAGTAKDMHNEGGRPFLFPGKVPGFEQTVPDFDLINPDYFRQMDKKIDYLNESGFFPFIEVARRDISLVWKKYGGWPDSYARYIQYIFSRYQANSCLLSPIHFDYSGYSIPSREYNDPANLVIDTWGSPPFGTLLGTNSAPSSLVNYGGPEEARWLTFLQIGNWREHDNYWYLTEIFHADPPRPALNGEPYYPGFPDNNPAADSQDAELNCRSGLYGSFLSGGFAGYFYGVEGLWGGDNSAASRYRMWESLEFDSGEQVGYIREFLSEVGLENICHLIPSDNLITPNRSDIALGYRGWAFCARTEANRQLLAYFEKGCPRSAAFGVSMFVGTILLSIERR